MAPRAMECAVGAFKASRHKQGIYRPIYQSFTATSQKDLKRPNFTQRRM